MEYNPHNYQTFATEHTVNTPCPGLFLDMGLGKTVSTLTAIDELMYNSLEINKVLVIAPKKVARDTWPEEIEKWDHTRHLRYSIVIGNVKQRKEALLAEADIYLINRENVAWMVNHYGGGFMPFDMLIVDELSSFKSPKAQRFKALRRVIPLFDRRVGLTGTPAPNGLVDIWSQIYILDRGERLGKTVTDFRNNYCYEDFSSRGQAYDKYEMTPASEQRIYDKISDICISMKSEDYLELPPQMDYVVNVKMDEKTTEQYNDFVKERIMEMMESSEGETVTAVNAAVLVGKLSQFANGAIYDENRKVHKLHDFKLEAFEDLVEEANGDPILAFYSFKHDLARIKESKRIGSLARELKTGQDMKDWNDGKIKLLLAHPASAGHGLNLQRGGCILAWFGIPWSLELYLQAAARIMRQGQTRPVKNYRFATEGTMDYKALKSLEGKKVGQDALMDAVKALIDRQKEFNRHETNK